MSSTITTRVNVPDELIINALESADIGYWANVPRGTDHAKLLSGAATALVYESEGSHDGKGDGLHELTSDKVRAGLQVLASKYPHHFADIVGDNSDCITCDALVQCALFGEIIYG
jgi:hypothetical protein